MLNKEEFKQIRLIINNWSLERAVEEELLDHYACIIEQKMLRGFSFNRAMEEAFKDLSKKILKEAFDKFYLNDKNIFQKSPKNNNDVFFAPVDIGDNTIPNGNAVMLINLIRLGMINEAKKLDDSLNGYLNIYKNHMMTSLRAIDYFNNIKEGKNCNEQGCKIDV